ncbi:transketolase family protein [Pseudostreptobacillus hongkongensis]|uniref:transketolase family protein n=1 Tax=Pseudostreptobacillus hongkongensis TaxID=1162717 RepID=UPI0008301C31|nr:transketolase C-terminal domain-containing protein [Pseudostreptobacillus hongkongensis]
MVYNYTSPRDHIGDILNEIAEANDKIVVIDSDLSSSVTTNKFQAKYPNRFFEMGIAEQNSLGVTSGLATEGFIPFYVNFSIFCIGTVWTQLRQACYAKLNIKLIGTHPGMDNGPDGASHHALEDLALSRSLANLTILNPIDLEDLKAAINKAIEIEGPVYIRVARDIVPILHEENISNYDLKIETIFNEGNDYAIIFEGTAAKQALDGFELLKKEGYKNKLISIKTIKPLDKEGIIKEISNVKGVLTVENHTLNGGLGSVISEVIAENALGVKLKRIGVKDTFTESGKTVDVKKKYGLDGENVRDTIINF